mgnify:FL=1
MQNGVAHTVIVVDHRIIAQIFKCNEEKTLVWDGYKLNKKGAKIKNQYWINQAIDLELHVKGIKKQGGCLNRKGKANCAVVDVDKEITEEDFGREAYKIDNTLVPFKSPSGRWHAWKLYHSDKPTAEVIKDIKRIEKEFIKLYGKDVDVDKTQPTKSGFTGINFPFCTELQYPYSPQGKRLTFKQFQFKYRFQHHPLIAIAAGLVEPGRHKTLLLIAAYLHKKNMMEHLDEVIGALDDFDDADYIKRIKDKKIHEKYDVSHKVIQKRLAEIVRHEEVIDWDEEEKKQDKKVKDFYNTENDKRHEAIDFEADATTPDAPIPLPNLKLPAAQPDTTELEIFEHTGLEKIKPRPWLIYGLLLERALTLVVGQPGVGKTMLLHMLAYSLATGNLFFTKDVVVRGNVLGVFGEETSNESDIRWAACKQTMGKNDGRFKLYKRGLEHDLKLVQFTKESARATKQYQQLRNTIKSRNIKYIVLDPLINFQTGSYDENNNQNMDAYVKNYLIPLAIEMNGAVIAGHHTNKLSMVSTQDNELLVDNQNALMAARGASSLIGAARFVLALQPMTKKLWEQHFKEHVTDGSNFIHYTGLIEAKSNYNLIAEDISWLRKDSIPVPTTDGLTESTGIYFTTDLNKVTKAKNKLKAAQNLNWCKAQLPTVQKLMAAADDDTITLNSVVLELLPMEPDFADQNVNENTIKTKIRRKLENGFSGKEETKDGYVRSGIECADGYNYWLHRDHGATGAAKVFIKRAIDFKRKNKK